MSQPVEPRRFYPLHLSYVYLDLLFGSSKVSPQLLAELQESYIPLWSGDISFFSHFYKRASKQADVQTPDQQVNEFTLLNLFFTSDSWPSNKSRWGTFIATLPLKPFFVAQTGLWEQARRGQSPPSTTQCEDEAQGECVRVKNVKGHLCFLSCRLCKSWPISI